MDHQFKPLGELDDWELVNKDQDLRNRPVMDASGQKIGVVRQMLVDRDAERVAALVLDDGRTVPVEQVQTRADAVYLRGAGAGAMDAGGREAVIPIVEEQIRVGKRTVDRGGVRVTSEVVETPVQEQVTLREEHVDVERRPVNRIVDDPDALLRDRTLEVSESAEEAVVAKEAVVTEEVVVRKDVEEHTAEVRDTVRHTEVEIERDGPGLR